MANVKHAQLITFSIMKEFVDKLSLNVNNLTEEWESAKIATEDIQFMMEPVLKQKFWPIWKTFQLDVENMTEISATNALLDM